MVSVGGTFQPLSLPFPFSAPNACPQDILMASSLPSVVCSGVTLTEVFPGHPVYNCDALPTRAHASPLQLRRALSPHH